MDQEYVAREFFHFVGRSEPTNDEKNYEILSRVLTIQTISHPPHNPDWGLHSFSTDLDGKLLDGSLIVNTVTCYCDIPFESLGIHVTKYGKFGLSFHREPLIYFGARPVIYIPINVGDHLPTMSGRHVLNDIEGAYKGYMQFVFHDGLPNSRSIDTPPKDKDHALSAMKQVYEFHVLAFIKPYDGRLAQDHPNNYYMEREWRKHGNYRFEPDHVIRVVVPESYGERFAKDFPAYADKITVI